MNTILRPGDKVRIVRDDTGLRAFSVVTLKEKLTASIWSIEEIGLEHFILEEDACGVACLRCQPGGCFEHPCTCRVLVCASCKGKSRGFLEKCECGGTYYPE